MNGTWRTFAYRRVDRSLARRFTLMIVLVWLLVVGGNHALADEKTPIGEEYQTLLKAYGRVSGGLRKAKTDSERKAAVDRMSGFAATFVKLAADHPKDQIALTSLKQAIQVVGSMDSAALQTWEMNRADFAQGSRDDSTAQIVRHVLRNHLQSEQLGPVIDRMRYAYRLEFEACLRTIVEKNPHHEIQGLACLAMAQFLSDKLRMLELVRDRPQLAKGYQIVFGPDFLPALKRLGQANLETRIERLLEKAAQEYKTVKFRNTTVGAIAKSELYDLRHLRVGKKAPDIQGKDQNGDPLNLSDHLGKVVLLYFWSEF